MQHDIHTEIGGRIKHLRRAVLCMTLGELSRRVRRSQSYLEKIEGGRQDVPLSLLARIAAVLGIDLALLLATEPSGWAPVVLDIATRWRRLGADPRAFDAWLSAAPRRLAPRRRDRNPRKPHNP